MRQQAAMFKKAGVITLCIFKSTPQNIAKYSSASSNGDVIALSDTKGSVFNSFMVPKSTRAAINGSIHILKNLRKYRQVLDVSGALRDTSGGTNLNQLRQLPADFMIDEDGLIVDLLRAEHMTDHMPFERVERFIPKDKRCKCNRKECIVSALKPKLEMLPCIALLFMLSNFAFLNFCRMDYLRSRGAERTMKIS